MSRLTSKLLSEARAAQKAAEKEKWASLDASVQALLQSTQDPNVIEVVSKLIAIIKQQEKDIKSAQRHAEDGYCHD